MSVISIGKYLDGIFKSTYCNALVFVVVYAYINYLIELSLNVHRLSITSVTVAT
eukprot:Gb_17520 [translate_table: standard]